MQGRFSGARGSLPTALTARALREKLVDALVAGSGRELDTPEKARAFVETLPFSLANTFGGNSPCLELIAEGAPRVLLDMGSGAGVKRFEGSAEPTDDQTLVLVSWRH